MNRFRSFFRLLDVHFKTFFREPAILFWALGFPVVMAWILGIAFSQKKEIKANIMVVNAEQIFKENISNKFTVDKIGEDIYNPSSIKVTYGTASEAMTAMKRGEIELFMELRKDSMIFHYDPVDPEAVNIYLMLEREFSKNETVRKKIKVQPIVTQGNRYIDFLIPGLIAFGIMNSCVWGIGWTLIEFRMKKLLRRMVATPMKKNEFMASHFAARIILCTLETFILFLFAWIYFDFTLLGNFAALVLIFLSGIIAFFGISVLLASRVSNSQVGNGLVNAVTLPMMILSGVFFSYQSFPEWAIPIIKALPLTTLADSLRTIFNEGAGITTIWIHAIVLITEGIVCYVIGMKVYKWY